MKRGAKGFYEDSRETRHGTNGRGPETTGPLEPSWGGVEGAIVLRDGEEHHSNPATDCEKDLAPVPSRG
jgi:hypothetical protein